MKPADHPELDFEHELPADKEWFSLSWLARRWGVSTRNVQRLVDEGSLPTVADFSPKGSKHALHRVHRTALVAFLEDRIKLAKFEAMRLAHRKGRFTPLNARSQRHEVQMHSDSTTPRPADPVRSSLL